MDFNTFMAEHIQERNICKLDVTFSKLESIILLSASGVKKHTALTTHTFYFSLKLFLRCCNTLLHTDQHCDRNLNLWSFIIMASQTF